MTADQRRLRRSATFHGIAAVIFLLLALLGASAAAQGLPGLAAPMIIAGLAGAAGAAAVAVAIRRGTPQRTARLATAAAAVPVLLAGTALAPAGLDRGFVITVAALLAALVALFALFSGDRPRSVVS